MFSALTFVLPSAGPTSLEDYSNRCIFGSKSGTKSLTKLFPSICHIWLIRFTQKITAVIYFIHIIQLSLFSAQSIKSPNIFPNSGIILELYRAGLPSKDGLSCVRVHKVFLRATLQNSELASIINIYASSAVVKHTIRQRTSIFRKTSPLTYPDNS